MKGIISFFLGFAASYTVVSKAAENPDGIKRTVIKTGQTAACGIGIVKVPKIAYIGIELLVTALMTKPVLAFINSFTVEWANQNQDTVSDSLAITLGILMLAGSIIISAIIGLIVCMLIKAITAKNG